MKNKVYCKDCEFLYESILPTSEYQSKTYICKHPINLRTVYDWYGTREESINEPQELNWNNNCPNFKQKGK
jgi:hypothetical protein